MVAVSFRGAGRRRQRHREGIFNSEIQKEDWKENSHGSLSCCTESEIEALLRALSSHFTDVLKPEKPPPCPLSETCPCGDM